MHSMQRKNSTWEGLDGVIELVQGGNSTPGKEHCVPQVDTSEFVCFSLYQNYPSHEHQYDLLPPFHQTSLPQGSVLLVTLGSCLFVFSS